MLLLFADRNISLCSLEVIAQDTVYRHLFGARVCLGFGSRQCEMLTRMKNRIIHYPLFVCDYI